MIELVTVVGGGVAAVALVVRATLLARKAGDRVGAGPTVLAAAASSLAAAALLGPLDGLAEELLAGHMLQHVVVGDLVPLLLVLAVRGPVLRHLAPAPLARGLARPAGLVFRPVPALLLWAASVALWHVPRLYDLALEHAPVHAVEHASFVAGGILVWSQLLDPAGLGRLAGWRRFGYALGLLACSQMLANALVLSYRPLYAAYAEATSRPLGLSAVGDQDLAAVVMMVEQLATLGTFAFLAGRRLARATRRPVAERHPLAA